MFKMFLMKCTQFWRSNQCVHFESTSVVQKTYTASGNLVCFYKILYFNLNFPEQKIVINSLNRLLKYFTYYIFFILTISSHKWHNYQSIALHLFVNYNIKTSKSNSAFASMLVSNYKTSVYIFPLNLILSIWHQMQARDDFFSLPRVFLR